MSGSAPPSPAPEAAAAKDAVSIEGTYEVTIKKKGAGSGGGSRRRRAKKSKKRANKRRTRSRK
jgi:hypothetical protein